MSYRTYVNGTQIFGNNDGYIEWFDFLKSKGVEINEDGLYDDYIDDLQGMFEVIDKITKRLIDERHEQVVKGETNWDGEPYKELTDLSESIYLNDKTPILMYNMQMINHAYCFLPYQVFMAVEDIIEKTDKPYIVEKANKPYISEKEWYFCSYKLKDGERIHVSAY